MSDSSELHNPPTPIPDHLVITHLHMPSRADFRPAYSEHPDAAIVRLALPDVRYYRFLYSAVGEAWRWRDRLIMPDADLEAILRSPTNEVHVLQVAGTPAGYFELETADGTSHIAYLGLRPEYMGLGLGKHLLSTGIACAWQRPTERLTVQTCNLDAPSALDNYLKRGFSVTHIDRQPMPVRYS
ncbi:MAG: GNAT family N-acetyltransferase [Chloroflexota bacterium]|nr:GNAT family N-acetyltransferase [Chloroflexota bacterium]